MTGEIDFLRILQRWIIALLIVTVAAFAVIGVLMVLLEPRDAVVEMLLLTPVIVAVTLIVVLAHVTILRRTQSSIVCMGMVLGIVLAIAGMSLFLTFIFVDESWYSEEWLARTGSGGLVLAAALAYGGAFSLVRTKARLLQVMAGVTVVCAWIAAAVTIVLLLEIDALERDFGFVIAMALALAISLFITAVGTIAVPIALVSRNSKPIESNESIDPRVQVRLGCPKCGERQTHRPGYVKCAKCRVGLFIEIEEPRCECGYLLYRLTGEHCPECGKPVALGAAAKPQA